MFKLIKKNNEARRGEFITRHGAVQTPVFMNVATCGAIKGGLSAYDLEQIKCQVMLCNTYHLHLRPGDKTVKDRGGLHKFTTWNGPILTDSGGFQVFSLSSLRKITEEGVTFSSHLDGSRIFMGPEESMNIQFNLGSDIAMAFDECVENPSEYKYVKDSSLRTIHWLERCVKENDKLNQQDHSFSQMLFGINQGSTYDDIRIENMKNIASFDLPGYAIGGLAVGEDTSEMYRIIESVIPYMPTNKPRYLMGVGTPVNIIEGVKRGIDFFDCVMPSRNARHGHLFTSKGIVNIHNAKYINDDSPLDDNCDCPCCKRYTKAYLRHLLCSGEMLAMRLAVIHNLRFYNKLMEDIRLSIENNSFNSFAEEKIEIYGKRI